MGMVSKIVDLKKTITHSIFVQMAQKTSLSASTQRMNMDGLVTRYNWRSDNDILEV